MGQTSRMPMILSSIVTVIFTLLPATETQMITSTGLSSGGLTITSVQSQGQTITSMDPSNPIGQQVQTVTTQITANGDPDSALEALETETNADPFDAVPRCPRTRCTPLPSDCPRVVQTSFFYRGRRCRGCPVCVRPCPNVFCIARTCPNQKLGPIIERGGSLCSGCPVCDEVQCPQLSCPSLPPTCTGGRVTVRPNIVCGRSCTGCLICDRSVPELSPPTPSPMCPFPFCQPVSTCANLLCPTISSRCTRIFPGVQTTFQGRTCTTCARCAIQSIGMF